MKKFLRPRTVLAAVLFALLAFLLGAVLWNRGHARYEALPEADRFMLDEWNTCLLYTSPSPRDRG